MIGPGRDVTGGMSELLKMLSADPFWTEYGCEWLETCDARSRAAKLFALLRALIRFRAALGSRAIVHIHAGSGTSFIRKSLFLICAKLSGRKVVLQLHTTDALFRTTPLALIRAVLTRADAVVVLSSRFADELRARIPGIVVEVLRNPVWEPPLERRKPANGPVTILFLGRIEESKGVFDLLRAFAIVRKTHPATRLRLAASGAIAEARVVCRELGIEDAVEFLGWVSGGVKAEALNSAGIFCLPSHYEALPLSLLEAMSFGLPAVCTSVGAVPEVLTHGKTGLLVEAHDVNGLAAALSLLIGNPEMRTAIGAAAERASREYSIDAFAARLGGLYARLGDGAALPAASHSLAT
jgi:glycosyltransferase involved in cell wall biosynthesis